MMTDRPIQEAGQPQQRQPSLSRDNDLIAMQLREGADLLQAQGANPFRAGAYRKAADTVARLPQSIRNVFDEQGREGLEALPGIGRGIASSIIEMLIPLTVSRPGSQPGLLLGAQSADHQLHPVITTTRKPGCPLWCVESSA